MSWQPIETAPKDGTWVIGNDPDGSKALNGCVFMRYYPDFVPSWVTAEDEEINPTHWMPLPVQPTEPAGGPKT